MYIIQTNYFLITTAIKCIFEIITYAIIVNTCSLHRETILSRYANNILAALKIIDNYDSTLISKLKVKMAPES